jgi:hypothetical protein
VLPSWKNKENPREVSQTHLLAMSTFAIRRKIHTCAARGGKSKCPRPRNNQYFPDAGISVFVAQAVNSLRSRQEEEGVTMICTLAATRSGHHRGRRLVYPRTRQASFERQLCPSRRGVARPARIRQYLGRRRAALGAPCPSTLRRPAAARVRASRHRQVQHRG